jgi:hypothetical protein
MGPKFSLQISNKAQMLSFIKILQVGAELFHADGQADSKLIVAFSQFCERP